MAIIDKLTQINNSLDTVLEESKTALMDKGADISSIKNINGIPAAIASLTAKDAVDSVYYESVNDYNNDFIMHQKDPDTGVYKRTHRTVELDLPFTTARCIYNREGTVRIGALNVDKGYSLYSLLEGSYDYSNGELLDSVPRSATYEFARVSDRTFLDVQIVGDYSKYILAIGIDGNLYSWGYPTVGDGVTGDNYFDPNPNKQETHRVPYLVDASGNWEKIYAFPSNTWVINTLGEVYCCGDNSNYRLGLPRTTQYWRLTKVTAFNDTIKKIVASNSATFVLTSGGSLYVVGTGDYGILGLGANTSSDGYTSVITQSKEFSLISDNVSDVFCGNYNAGYITVEGDLYVWGRNNYLQLAQGNDNLYNPENIGWNNTYEEPMFGISWENEERTSIRVSGALEFHIYSIDNTGTHLVLSADQKGVTEPRIYFENNTAIDGDPTTGEWVPNYSYASGSLTFSKIDGGYVITGQYNSKINGNYIYESSIDSYCKRSKFNGIYNKTTVPEDSYQFYDVDWFFRHQDNPNIIAYVSIYELYSNWVIAEMDGEYPSTYCSGTSRIDSDIAVPTQIVVADTDGIKKWKQASFGEGHLIALDSTNVAWGAGKASQGQCGSYTTSAYISVLTKVDSDLAWSYVSCKGDCSMFLESKFNRLYYSGSSSTRYGGGSSSNVNCYVPTYNGVRVVNPKRLEFSYILAKTISQAEVSDILYCRNALPSTLVIPKTLGTLSPEIFSGYMHTYQGINVDKLFLPKGFRPSKNNFASFYNTKIFFEEDERYLIDVPGYDTHWGHESYQNITDQVYISFGVTYPGTDVSPFFFHMLAGYWKLSNLEIPDYVSQISDSFNNLNLRSIVIHKNIKKLSGCFNKCYYRSKRSAYGDILEDNEPVKVYIDDVSLTHPINAFLQDGVYDVYCNWEFGSKPEIEQYLQNLNKVTVTYNSYDTLFDKVRLTALAPETVITLSIKGVTLEYFKYLVHSNTVDSKVESNKPYNITNYTTSPLYAKCSIVLHDVGDYVDVYCKDAPMELSPDQYLEIRAEGEARIQGNLLSLQDTRLPTIRQDYAFSNLFKGDFTEFDSELPDQSDYKVEPDTFRAIISNRDWLDYDIDAYIYERMFPNIFTIPSAITNWGDIEHGFTIDSDDDTMSLTYIRDIRYNYGTDSWLSDDPVWLYDILHPRVFSTYELEHRLYLCTNGYDDVVAECWCINFKQQGTSILSRIRCTSTKATINYTKNPTAFFSGGSTPVFIDKVSSLNTNQAPKGAFYRTFAETKLRVAPALPFKNASRELYYETFADCLELTTVGDISADIVEQSSFYGTYKNCSKLQEAPKFHPYSVYTSGLAHMFEGCESLSNPINLEAVQRASWGAFKYLYKGCKSLKTTGKLPELEVVNDELYTSMCEDCITLEEASDITATYAGSSAFESTYRNCKLLQSAPQLNIDEVGPYAFRSVFEGCESMKGPFTLTCVRLHGGCCNEMFKNCASFDEITVSFDTWLFGTTTDWLAGVSATGIFRKPEELNIEQDVSRIPAGWTVIDIDKN